MAATKQKTRTITTTEREIPVENDVPRETKPDKDEADERDLVELGGGAPSGNKWVVKCIAPIAQQGHCCEVAAGELSLARIAEEYGAGKYEFRLLDPRGVYVTQRTITLRASNKASNQPAPISAPVSPLNDPIVQLLLAQSKEQVAMLTNVLQTAFQRPQPAVADPLDMLVKMKEFFQPSKGPTEMETFLRGLEFGKDLQGGGGETNWLDLISQGVKHVGPLLAASSRDTGQAVASQTPIRTLPSRAVESTRQQAPASASNNSSDNRNVNVETRPESEGAPMLKLLNWMRIQVNGLVYQASRGKSPELYAEVFLDNLPDYVPIDEMLKRLQDDNAVTQLAQLNKDVLTFKPWFEEFRAAVLKMMQQPDDQESSQESAIDPAPMSDGSSTDG